VHKRLRAGTTVGTLRWRMGRAGRERGLGWRLAAGSAVAGAVLAGCSAGPRPAPEAVVYDEDLFAAKPQIVHEVPLEPGSGTPAATVIGGLGRHRVREGETFLEIARISGLGFNELVGANPGIDPWVPPVGIELLLPTQWVLPCCRYDGVVVNVPEMRLYRYERDGDRLRVWTYPVGVGRPDRRTPTGSFHVREKTEDPTWVIPESIRREHIRERGDTRTAIAGGDPENPLGRYRLTLSRPRYAIHGTNIPWGPGMPVSHGCIRLYPEDIERLYPHVPVGEPVHIVYQPAKIGRVGDRVYAEVHADLYERVPSMATEMARSLRQAGVGDALDDGRLARTVAAGHGVPQRISLR
jgi:L,D-transpeptidase ErfK/SrfK